MQQQANPVQRIVLVAADLSSGGGVNKVIRDLAEMFSDQLGLDVSVVNARSGAAPSYRFPPQVTIEHHRRGGLLPYLKVLWRLRKTRPDVVIGSWAQDNILLALSFLFSSSRVVLVEHASWHFHSHAIQGLRRLIYPLASHVVVLNRGDLDHYSRWLGNVRLIPNPVAHFADAATPTPREKLILAVGHLEPVKNFEDAVRAFHRSQLEQQGWSLAVIGSGNEKRALRQLIADLGLSRVQIHPPTTDLGAWYRRASLLVIPSRTESFSLVLTEAMHAGVVPIAYATDGPTFILEDFPDHLVDIGDVPGLARRMVHLASRDDLTPLGAELAASIQTRFSPAIIADKWRKLLSQG